MRVPWVHAKFMVERSPLLEVRALGKSVPGPRQLDLDVAAGELVAIIGESGVGKSTLLNILEGLDDADEGSVRIDGTILGLLDETARTRLRRTRIGFVFQAFHILPYLTLRQNVALPLALVSPDAAAVADRAEAMLDAVGLSGRGNAGSCDQNLRVGSRHARQTSFSCERRQFLGTSARYFVMHDTSSP